MGYLSRFMSQFDGEKKGLNCFLWLPQTWAYTRKSNWEVRLAPKMHGFVKPAE